MRIRHRIVVAAAAAALVSSVGGIAHADPPAKESAHEGVAARDVVAYTALGLGAAALVFGVAETVHWYSVDQDGRSVASQVPSSVHNACADQVSAAAATLCQDSKDTSTAWTLALIGYGSAAALATTGIVLLVTRPHDTTSNSGRLDVTPAVSQRSAGVQLRLSF
jgi:hypothetical protein